MIITFFKFTFIKIKVFQNGNRRYKTVLGHEEPYLTKEKSHSKSEYTEDDIINMLECKVDNIFVNFRGKILQRIVGTPMGTNCAPLLADISIHIRSEIHTVFALGWKETVSSSVQLHIEKQRWRIVSNPDFKNYMS